MPSASDRLWPSIPLLDGGGVGTLPSSTRLIFVSYARKDGANWCRAFSTMLSPLGDDDLAVWCDQEITVGTVWRPELEAAIHRADAALVLVSPGLLASDFVCHEELPALIARAIPIAYVHVEASMAPKLGHFADVQWAHDPAHVLGDLPSANSEIVRICARLIDMLPSRRSPSKSGSADAMLTARRHHPEITSAAALGELFGVPPPPPEEVRRGEFDAVCQALRESGEGTVGITGQALGIFGQGGIGKTVLAASVVRDHTTRRHFPDGIHWVTAGQDADVVSLQLELLERLGAEPPVVRSVAAAAEALREALKDRRCLIVVDDVWSASTAIAFAVTGPQGRVLLTTRHLSVLDAVHASVQNLGRLEDTAARMLLAKLTGAAVADLPPEVSTIIDATGGVALALALIGATIGRSSRSWTDVAADVADESNSFLDHPYADVFKAMDIAFASLTPGLRHAYSCLAVYPEDVRIPQATIGRQWEYVGLAAGRVELRSTLEELAARELLVFDDGAVAFHDLQRDFLLLRAHDLPLMHADLLAAHASRGLFDWRELNVSDPYIWDFLVLHLIAACELQVVHSLTTDVRYLATRCHRDGPHAVESDLRRIVELSADDEEASWLLDLFARWGYQFAGHSTLPQTAAAICVRLQDAPLAIRREALDFGMVPPVLVPETGVPDAPMALRRVLEGHHGWVWAMAFSPDGRLLASVGDDATVRLWDVDSGSELALLSGHRGGVWTVAFSPGGRTLASGGEGGTVRLWDVATGAAIGRLEVGSAVHALAFSPDGLTLATGQRDWQTTLWRLDEISRRDGPRHGGEVRAVAFSPDGQWLATAGHDKRIQVSSPLTGELLFELEGHTDTVFALAFSPGSDVLASVGYDRWVRVWELTTRSQRKPLGHGRSPLLAVSLSHDGAHLAFAGEAGEVTLYDFSSGRERVMAVGHASDVRSVAYAPDGQMVATAGQDGTVRFADPEAAPPRAFGRVDVVPGVPLAWAPNRPALVTADGSRAYLRDEAGLVSSIDDHFGNDESDDEDMRLRHNIVAAEFSSEGRFVATLDASKALRIWCETNSAAGWSSTLLASSVASMAFSPRDDALLATRGSRGFSVWGAATGRETYHVPDPMGLSQPLVFSADGDQVAWVSGDDSTVCVWSLTEQKIIAKLTHAPARIISLHAAPDDALVSIADHHVARLWDLRTFELRASWRVYGLQLELVLPKLGYAWTEVATSQVLLSDHDDPSNLRIVRERTHGVQFGGMAYSAAHDVLFAAAGSTLTSIDRRNPTQSTVLELGAELAGVVYAHGLVAVGSSATVDGPRDLRVLVAAVGQTES